MARPNKSSGKRTSFGKRTDAEKSFRNRKKEKPEGRYGEERPRRSSAGGFSKRSDEGSSRPSRFSKPTGGARRSFGDGDSSERPKRFSKPFGKREEGGDRPFRKSASSFGAKGPKRFSKPFDKKDEVNRPFRKSAGPFDSERPRRSSKPFQKRDDEGGFKRPSRSFESRSEKPEGFSKRSFDKPGRSFRKSDDESSSESRSSSRSFAKKPFGAKDRFEGKGKPFGERSDRFSKKSFDRKNDDRDEKPARKNTRFFDKREDSQEGFAKPFNPKLDVVKRVKGEAKAEALVKKQSGDDELIRLNKFMANSGVGSRRQADELIKMGLVTVNGETVTEMGHKVKPTDDVRYEGKKLKAEKPVYILLNKPKGFITTTDDPQERNTVMNLVANAGKERIYPVGRLDRNTTGLLLLTNDGDLADKLTHPSYNVKKIYKVELDKAITKNDLQKIADGVYLEEGRAMVDDVAVVSDDYKEIGIELHIGWNRIVRRIFESLGYEVVKLDRVVYAGLDKKDLTRGQWRFLKPEEIVRLKHFK